MLRQRVLTCAEECLPPHVVWSCLAGRQQAQQVQLVQRLLEGTGGHGTLQQQQRQQQQQQPPPKDRQQVKVDVTELFKTN